MPVRTRFGRFSEVDGLRCTGPGMSCTNDICMCQSCSICTERVAKVELEMKPHYLPSGQWVGPHCLSCDFDLFIEHGDRCKNADGTDPRDT